MNFSKRRKDEDHLHRHALDLYGEHFVMRHESRDYEHNLSDYVSDLRPPGSGNLTYRLLCDRVRL